MFNVLVNIEYELLFDNLKTEAPDSFSLALVDFKHPDEKLNALLCKTDAILGQVSLSDSQFESAGKLKIIQTLSAGYDKIDLEKAGQYKVRIANNNGANAVSVAEHVLMLIFALYRRLLFHHHSVTNGPWKNLKHTNSRLYIPEGRHPADCRLQPGKGEIRPGLGQQPTHGQFQRTSSWCPALLKEGGAYPEKPAGGKSLSRFDFIRANVQGTLSAQRGFQVARPVRALGGAIDP